MVVQKDHDDRPIGVFDSGFGGLTIMRQLIKTMPGENIIYFGDSINAPYGNKGKEEIIKLTLAAAKFLVKKKIKALIIACNTACVYAFDELNASLGIPVIEIISPSYQMAIKNTKNNKLGVTATKATIYSQVYRKKILQERPGAKVFSVACPKLVSIIENGLIDLEEASKIVKVYFGPIKKKEIDVLLLACTHYPLLKEIIQKEVGKGIKVLDPSVNIAEEVFNFLRGKNLLSRGNLPLYEFITSGEMEKFKAVAERFLERKIEKVEKKE